MLIKGFQATSLADYPGEIASIVFVAECDFRCPYCYNKLLVLNSPDLIELDEKKILEKISERRKLIDGVVISGGEPVLQKGLPEFAGKIKELELKVKVDTNGTNPDMIQELIDKGLADFIAMDIKGPLDKYNEIAMVKVNKSAIKKSTEIIMQGKTDYEFRTTALPDLLTKKDFLEIGKWLKGAKKYCIQQFKKMPDMIDESFAGKKTYSKEELEEIRKELEPYFERIEVRE
ncbi:anaerobic ribonucleoside-triphosphate reductase activating protein [Candidatus Woesearchaeota archaeon]|nr:anaerobic ribonucleoside-triphosphate reductase activating protein [Candidatus Woesearchaeota archaeon]